MKKMILCGNTVKKGVNIEGRFKIGDIIVNINDCNDVAKIIEVEYPNAHITCYSYLIEKIKNKQKIRILLPEKMLSNWIKL